MSSRMDRRTFLFGAGGVMVALPFLEIMGHSRPARATGNPGFPKRFVVVFSPDGIVPNQYWPTGSETAFTLGPIHAALAPHQKDLLILKGLDLVSASKDPASVDGGHVKPMGHMLTATAVQTTPSQSGGGISIDQTIANQIGTATKFKSLEFGVDANQAIDLERRMSYLGPGQPVPPENDPAKAFARIFSSVVTSANDPMAQALARRAAQRKSVLDAVLSDYGSLKARVGAADQRKLDAHLTAIRDVESRLTVTAAVSSSCAVPAAPPATTPDFPSTGKLQMDLLAMALACDLTRVASLQWSASASWTTFSWLGQTTNSHLLSHNDWTQFAECNKWYSQQLAYLIAKLKAIPEGSGTVFDNTVILSCSEIGTGAHTYTEIPFVLIGSGGGAFRTGRYVTVPAGTPHNNLFVSLQNAFGVSSNTFGDPAVCTGALGNLT